MKSRILLVDDQPVVLEGLQRVISRLRWSGEFVGTVTDPAKLDKSLAGFDCDVIVSETKYGGVDLIVLFERFAEKKKLPKLIFFSRARVIEAINFVLSCTFITTLPISCSNPPTKASSCR